MSFSQEVGQFFALTETQSAQLEAGLITFRTGLSASSSG